MKKLSLKAILILMSVFVTTVAANASWISFWSDEDEESKITKARSTGTPQTFKDSVSLEIPTASPKTTTNTNPATVKKQTSSAVMIDSNKDSDSFFNMNDVNNQKPIVLCRNKGCTELNDKMTQSFLFNSLANLLYINDKTKVYLCEANTSTRACTSNGLKYAVNVGNTASVIYIPSLTITDVSFSQNLKRINFMLSYDLYANGLKSFCTSSHNTIELSANKQALIRDNNYKCQLTSDLPSISYNIYNIDYIDLDYGIIGAYYSTGMSGASSGGNTGYVLMKFQYTDANLKRPQSGCVAGTCDAESYKIAPGQYEILPLENNK